MKFSYVFPFLLTAIFLTACGPSQEEKRQVEIEQQRIEQEASEQLAKEKADRVAAVTCSIMGETRNMDSAVRVRELNDAREKIGGEPFLGGDSAIKQSFEYGLCRELVLNDPDYFGKLNKALEIERTRLKAERLERETRKEAERYERETRKEAERLALEAREKAAKIEREKQEENARIAREKRKESLKIKREADKIIQEQLDKEYASQNGVFYTYFDDGRVDIVKNLRDGKLHGTITRYYQYPIKQIMFRTSYNVGLREGYQRKYAEDGTLAYSKCFKADKEVALSQCRR